MTLLVVLCVYVCLQLTWSADSYAPRRRRDPVLQVDWSKPQWQPVARALADAGYDPAAIKAVSVFSQAGNIRVIHLPHFSNGGFRRWEVSLARSLIAGEWKWEVPVFAACLIAALGVTPGVSSVSFWLIVGGTLFLVLVFKHVLMPLFDLKLIPHAGRRLVGGPVLEQEDDPRHSLSRRRIGWRLVALEAACIAASVYLEPGNVVFWLLGAALPAFLFYAAAQVRVNLLRSDSVIEVPVAWRSALRRNPLLAPVALAHEMGHVRHGDTAARRLLRQAVPWMAVLAWWDALNLIAALLPSTASHTPVHGRGGLVLFLAGSVVVLLLVSLSATAGIMQARRLLYAIHELRADAESCQDEAAMWHMHAIVAQAQQVAHSRVQAMRMRALAYSWADPLAGAFWKTVCIMTLGFYVPVIVAAVALWAGAFTVPPGI